MLLAANVFGPDHQLIHDSSDDSGPKALGSNAATPSAMLSEGSKLHEAGHCSPCRFITLPSGCKYGASCTFCHVAEHEVAYSKSSRPAKAVRSRYRLAIDRISNSGKSEEEKLQDFKLLALQAGNNSYILGLLKEIAPDVVKEVQASSASTGTAATHPVAPGQLSRSSQKMSL